jgi:hypothetical protein
MAKSIVEKRVYFRSGVIIPDPWHCRLDFPPQSLGRRDQGPFLKRHKLEGKPVVELYKQRIRSTSLWQV